MTQAQKPASGRSTIAERKKAAGWISNDLRKQRVAQGKLRPGNKNGEKCMCCGFMGSFGRCGKHDFPTGVNSYCRSFALNEGAPRHG